MIFLTLLNLSLLGNISSTFNLATNILPKSKVETVEVSNYVFSSPFLDQQLDQSSNLKFENLDQLNLKITKPAIKPVVATKVAAVNTKPKLTGDGGSLTITKIGLINQSLAKSSISKIADMDKKMLHSPVLESDISPNLCANYGNSYITGHSEPAYAKDKNYPAVNVFSDLNLLTIGDIIKVKNNQGVSCSYKVKGWDTVVTETNGNVSKEVFTNAYYKESTKAMLTIQTCQKGSATVRLLLRAEKI